MAIRRLLDPGRTLIDSVLVQHDRDRLVLGVGLERELRVDDLEKNSFSLSAKISNAGWPVGCAKKRLPSRVTVRITDGAS